MALNSKKYSAVHSKTGDDKVKLKTNFDEGHINTFLDLADNGTNPEFGALIYMIQEMQDELDYLRTEISANKDKTGISTSQAIAITANTAIVSFEGGTSTTLSFGDLVTVPPKVKGGKPTYNIVMTATKSGVSKSITLTLT